MCTYSLAVEFLKCYLSSLVDGFHYPHQLVGLIQCHISSILYTNTNLMQNYCFGVPFSFTPSRKIVLYFFVGRSYVSYCLKSETDSLYSLLNILFVRAFILIFGLTLGFTHSVKPRKKPIPLKKKIR